MSVAFWVPPSCSICDTTDDVRRCPIMTGIGFREPQDKQVYVCGECIVCWREGGGTTRDAIRKSRGIDK